MQVAGTKVIFLVVISSCFFQLRCSFVLPVIMADKNEGMQPTVPVKDARIFKKNKPSFKLRLSKSDDHVVEGEFIGLFKYEQTAYNQLYSAF